MNNKYTNPIILDDVDLKLFFHKNDIENAVKNNKNLIMLVIVYLSD